MKKKDNSKLLMGVLCGFLVVIFVVMFVYGLNRVLAMEGQFPPDDAENDAMTSEPLTNDEVLSLLHISLDRITMNNRKLVKSSSFTIDGESLQTDANDFVKQTLSYCLGGFEEKLNESSENKTVDFGDSISDVLNTPELREEDIKSFTCDYIYYECSSCNEISDVKKKSCDVCGAVKEYLTKYRDDYVITLDIDINEQLLDFDFNKRNAEQIKALYGNGFDGFLTVDKTEVNYNKLTLKFTVNRKTDYITNLEYIKDMTVSSSVTFTGDYSSLGSADISFKISESENNDFILGGISLDKHELVIVPKGNDNILATLTCDDPLKYEVTWTSSDPEIATVDESGYIKTTDKIGDAFIEASFVFNGETYKDSCVVHCMNAVESSAVSARKAKLSVGETKQLSAKLTPENATIKTVTWYTDDESVATVDEEGLVTAVGTGETKVYFITDDGYYKSSCEVTVK